MKAGNRLTTEESELIERYYRENYELLFKYAYHILKDPHSAEVAVQETFEVAARRIDKLTESENPIGWLFVVLKYKIMTIERKRDARMQHCVSLDDATARAKAMPEPEELAEDDEDIALLLRYYVEGYSLRELAAEQHITVPAIKMRIYRAKKRLRKNPKIKNLRNFE